MTSAPRCRSSQFVAPRFASRIPESTQNSMSRKGVFKFGNDQLDDRRAVRSRRDRRCRFCGTDGARRKPATISARPARRRERRLDRRIMIAARRARARTTAPPLRSITGIMSMPPHHCAAFVSCAPRDRACVTVIAGRGQHAKHHRLGHWRRAFESRAARRRA